MGLKIKLFEVEMKKREKPPRRVADNTLVWEIERCLSADECIKFHPDSLKLFLTGYYGSLPLDDLFTDMNQRNLPAGVRTKHPLI